MSQEYWRNNEQSSNTYNSNSQQDYNQSYPQQQWQYGGPNDNYNSGNQQQYGYGSGPNEPPSYNSGSNYNYNSNENQTYTQQQSYQSNEQWSSTSSWEKPPQQQNDEYSSNYDASRPLPPGAAAQPGVEGSYPGAPGPEGAEGERGLMGALAGGAAGAYGGHKIGHGFLGTIGGAIAGSKLEDYAKEKHKAGKVEGTYGPGPGPAPEAHQGWGDKWNNISHDDKMKYGMGAAGLAAAGGAGYYAWHHHQQENHRVQQPQVPPSTGHHGHKDVMAGNFSESSTQITLDGDYDLIASCGTVDGRQKLSSIKLNDCLSNEWGRFRWQRNGGFAGSARNIRLVDNGRVLEAELGDGRGGWNRDHVRLDEKISNDDGELILLD